MAGPTTLTQHQDYLQSDRWKCAESPTGAHHWYEPNPRQLPGVFYCRYCYEVRNFPTTIGAALAVSGYGFSQIALNMPKEQHPQDRDTKDRRRR